MEHNYTQHETVGLWEVKISPSTHYGCFEYQGNDEFQYAEGGLWFQGRSLVDYDGVYELPIPVVQGIRKMGYHIGR